MMNGETNAGYEIIEKLSVSNAIFSLGKMESSYGTKYATWQSRADDPNNYFWGHYMMQYEDAREDLFDRAHQESQLQNPNYAKRQADKLPDFCMSTLPSNGQLIVITHKESGYKVSELSGEHAIDNRYIADCFNKLMGITSAQESAMVSGSMFGWATPAAKPSCYDENGKPIKPKSKGYER